jgi:FkbM family methyltransferase
MKPSDWELSLLLLFTRRLPPVRGSGSLGHKIACWYARKPRASVECSITPTLKMRLNPHEYVDQDLLFVPQIYDRREIARLMSRLQPGMVFADLGANIGFHSLLAGERVGPSGKVLAIEADPETIVRLEHNLALNSSTQGNSWRERFTIFSGGVGPRAERLTFRINLRGNRGSSSFVTTQGDLAGDRLVEIECLPLQELLQRYALPNPQAMKLDIEGMGREVLQSYFEHLDSHGHSVHLPLVVMAEREPGLDDLLRKYGYKITAESSMNQAWERE